MDDREEHRGRSARSSVGGIYRSNRTVTTCLCHLLECACRCTCVFALTRVIFFSPLSSEMSGLHWLCAKCFVCKHSLFSPVCGIVCISWPLSPMIYAIHSLSRSFYSQLLVIPLALRCVRGDTAPFKVSTSISIACDNMFIIILNNIIDYGLTWGLDNAEGERSLNQYHHVK